MSVNIKSFNIESYKGLANITLDNLNIINVLTGDNNSGKTSVMELLKTLENPNNVYNWVSGIRFWNARFKGTQIFDGFKFLFPIHKKEKEIEYSFISLDNVRHVVKLRANIEMTKVSTEDVKKISRRRYIGHEDSGFLIDAHVMHLYSDVDGNNSELTSLYDFQGEFIRKLVPSKKMFLKTVYISPSDHVLKTFSLQSILNNVEQHEMLIKLLKSFDENVERIIVINESPVEYGFILSNSEEAMPISSFGDGMKKTILMLAALISAKDGILMIDEFETAIHTSAMKNVFEWLIKAAIELNVQVFLTSHSKEAIEKILDLKEYKQFINVYTLYKHEGNNFVRRLTGEEAINVSENLGMELR